MVGAWPGKGGAAMREKETEFLIPAGRGGIWDLGFRRDSLVRPDLWGGGYVMNFKRNVGDIGKVLHSWCSALWIWETSGQVGVKNRVQTSAPMVLDLICDFFPQVLTKMCCSSLSPSAILIQ